jgi:hypothetical protein
MSDIEKLGQDLSFEFEEDFDDEEREALSVWRSQNSASTATS